MIEHHFPSKRVYTPVVVTKPSVPWVSSSSNDDIADVSDKDKNTSFVFEKIRRDKIVREAYKNCMWKVGDFVMPHSEEEKKRWGANQCRVTAIARNLIEYGEEDWPKSDNPLIVCVHIEGTTKSFFCTPEYLVKYEATTAKV